ncbi:MAG: hypothetical protein KVP17_004644 [Porospora cf. gigantea B]|uniref:uncharacterized protein n=1 Tax=Porospora cf. gigantea B TaxID=2853592 RepID=UPI0035718CDE|nr:MAG: hypothetical protein KVP17_004644 [Porospora cf. gigantea B]
MRATTIFCVLTLCGEAVNPVKAIVGFIKNKRKPSSVPPEPLYDEVDETTMNIQPKQAAVQPKQAAVQPKQAAVQPKQALRPVPVKAIHQADEDVYDLTTDSEAERRAKHGEKLDDSTYSQTTPQLDTDEYGYGHLNHDALKVSNLADREYDTNQSLNADYNVINGNRNPPPPESFYSEAILPGPPSPKRPKTKPSRNLSGEGLDTYDDAWSSAPGRSAPGRSAPGRRDWSPAPLPQKTGTDGYEIVDFPDDNNDVKPRIRRNSAGKDRQSVARAADAKALRSVSRRHSLKSDKQPKKPVLGRAHNDLQDIIGRQRKL